MHTKSQIYICLFVSTIIFSPWAANCHRIELFSFCEIDTQSIEVSSFKYENEKYSILLRVNNRCGLFSIGDTIGIKNSSIIIDSINVNVEGSIYKGYIVIKEIPEITNSIYDPTTFEIINLKGTYFAFPHAWVVLDTIKDYRASVKVFDLPGKNTPNRYIHGNDTLTVINDTLINLNQHLQLNYPASYSQCETNVLRLIFKADNKEIFKTAELFKGCDIAGGQTIISRYHHWIQFGVSVTSLHYPSTNFDKIYGLQDSEKYIRYYDMSIGDSVLFTFDNNAITLLETVFTRFYTFCRVKISKIDFAQKRNNNRTVYKIFTGNSGKMKLFNLKGELIGNMVDKTITRKTYNVIGKGIIVRVNNQNVSSIYVNLKNHK